MSLSLKAQQRIAAAARDVVSRLSAALAAAGDYATFRAKLNAEQRAALDEVLPPAQVSAAVTAITGYRDALATRLAAFEGEDIP